MRPWRSRTQRPPLMSIAGMISNVVLTRRALLDASSTVPRAVPTKFASSRNPSRALFSGWNWQAKKPGAATADAKSAPCPQRPRDERVVVRHAVVAVREVEPRAVLDAGPQRMIERLAHLAPAHVRHLQPLAVGSVQGCVEACARCRAPPRGNPRRRSRRCARTAPGTPCRSRGTGRVCRPSRRRPGRGRCPPAPPCSRAPPPAPGTGSGRCPR